MFLNDIKEVVDKLENVESWVFILFKNNIVSGFLIISFMLCYLLKCCRDARSHGALCFGVWIVMFIAIYM